MEAWQIATVEGDQVSPVGGRFPGHAVGGVEQFPPAPGLGVGIGQADGGLQSGFQDRSWQNLLALYFPSFMRAMSQWDMSSRLEMMAPQGAMPAVSS